MKIMTVLSQYCPSLTPPCSFLRSLQSGEKGGLGLQNQWGMPPTLGCNENLNLIENCYSKILLMPQNRHYNEVRVL